MIVVDNNSTDGTAHLARGYGVRVVDEPEVGVCAARQRGADAAVGEIIVSTDADTVHPANWLRSIDANFSDLSVAAVAGPCRFENAEGWKEGYPRLLFNLVARIFAMTGFVFYVSATNLAMRRTAFPGYDPKQTQGGDELDVLRRIRKRGVVVWDQTNVVTTNGGIPILLALTRILARNRPPPRESWNTRELCLVLTPGPIVSAG